MYIERDETEPQKTSNPQKPQKRAQNQTSIHAFKGVKSSARISLSLMGITCGKADVYIYAFGVLLIGDRAIGRWGIEMGVGVR